MRQDDLSEDRDDSEHPPEERARAGARRTRVGVGVNVGLATTQVIVGIVERSQGLIADGVHSLADLVADIVGLFETPGVRYIHDVRTRKMGDQIVVDAHLEVEATLTAEADHGIAVLARRRVLERHRVLHLMRHVDPWRPPTTLPMAVDRRRIAAGDTGARTSCVQA